MRKNKIKILFRIRSMETGGVQKVLLNILNKLNKNKFEITLLLNLYQGELLEDIPKDIKVYYIGKGRDFLSKNSLIQKIQLILRRFKLKLYNIFPIFLYNNLGIKNQDIEIAFSHYNFQEVLKSPNYKSKKVGWMHGDIRNVTILGDKKKFVDGFLKFDKMVYVSNQTMESAKTFNAKIESNAEIIYNPIDVDIIINKSKQKIKEELSSIKVDGIPSFLFVGRYTWGKGIQLLYEAHKKLIRENKFHKIYLIGEGKYEQELKNLYLEDKIIDNTFIFLGKRDNPYPYFKKLDFFILPSRSEAYPLVIPEALILEKPVLVTDVGGIREMMNDKENGLIVSISSEDVYKGMKVFLENENFISKVIQNNKKTIEKFDPEKSINSIENFLISLYEP